MRPYIAALVAAACILAAALGWLVGLGGADPLRAGANAASRQQVYQQCLEEADAMTDGVYNYREYEERVPAAIEKRKECERLYGSVAREGTVEAQGTEVEQ